MMKTLCVAVVVLSLISVCQAASLVCQKLMKPVDQDPDISGTWHYIAFSTDHCWLATLLNVFFWPSIAMVITAKSTPNIYEGNFKVKMYGFCGNYSDSFHFANHNIFKVDRNNAPTGEADVLLQTGCPDCIVVKGVNVMKTLLLFSRRKSIDAAEMKEFETQAECLGLSKPRVYNTDHDYQNCTSVHDDYIDEKAATTFFTKLYNRVKIMEHKVTECFKDSLLAYLPTSISQN